MKKIDLGQSLQIFGNLAVVVGILLLVYELGQNREMMEVQARSDIANTLVAISLQSAASPDIESVTVKANSNMPMTPVEAEHYSDLQSAFWTYRANVAYLFDRGLYSEAEYTAQKQRWARFLNTSAAQREWWCERRGLQPAEFAAEIDVLLERPC